MHFIFVMRKILNKMLKLSLLAITEVFFFVRIKLLTTLFLDLFANFFRFVVTLFIGNRNCLESANLLGDFFTGVVGSQDLDLMAVGSSQGSFTLGLTVHIQRSLTNLRTMTIRDVNQPEPGNSPTLPCHSD